MAPNAIRMVLDLFTLIVPEFVSQARGKFIRRKSLIADIKKDKCTAITNLNYYLLKLISV